MPSLSVVPVAVAVAAVAVAPPPGDCSACDSLRCSLDEQRRDAATKEIAWREEKAQYERRIQSLKERVAELKRASSRGSRSGDGGTKSSGRKRPASRAEKSSGSDDDACPTKRKKRSDSAPPRLCLCDGCARADDCGKCKECLDKPKFGGPNKKRKKCTRRKCIKTKAAVAGSAGKVQRDSSTKTAPVIPRHSLVLGTAPSAASLAKSSPLSSTSNSSVEWSASISSATSPLLKLAKKSSPPSHDTDTDDEESEKSNERWQWLESEYGAAAARAFDVTARKRYIGIGNNKKKHFDFYYVHRESGTRLRSKPDVQRFLASMADEEKREGKGAGMEATRKAVSNNKSSSSVEKRPVKKETVCDSTEEAKKKMKTSRTGCLCPGCSRDDCGTCACCLDKPKFGGPNKRKTRCVQRRCTVGSKARAMARSLPAPPAQPRIHPWFVQLEQVKQHIDSGQSFGPNHKLHKWCRTQFAQYNKPADESTLTAEMRAAFDAAGIAAIMRETSAMEDKEKEREWTENVKKVRQFKEATGHHNPTESNAPKTLVRFVRSARQAYRMWREGKPSTILTDDRRAQLDAIRFEWDANKYHEEQKRLRWEGKLQEWINYKAARASFGANYKMSSSSLNGWVSTQRKEYRLFQEGQKSNMTQEKIARLKSAGFEWEAPPLVESVAEKDRVQKALEAWYAQYQKLKEVKESTGSVNVPQSMSTSLRSWAHTQRKEYERWTAGGGGSFSEEKKTALDALQFNFQLAKVDPREEREKLWRAKLEVLKKYKTVHGNMDVEHTFHDKSLYNWVKGQRTAYRQRQEGKPAALTDERLALLEEIGFKFSQESKHEAASRERWDLLMNQLRIFRMAHGHLNVPRDSELWNWLLNQQRKRQQAQKGQLQWYNVERARQLTDLGFRWDLRTQADIERDNAWHRNVDDLLTHKALYGTLDNITDSKLKGWCNSQRGAYKNKTLSEERRLVLEQLGFNWEGKQHD